MWIGHAASAGILQRRRTEDTVAGTAAIVHEGFTESVTEFPEI
jgi:hypothetical protein